MTAEKSRRSFMTKLMTIVAGVWVVGGSTACDREVAAKYGGPPVPPGPAPKYGGPPELLSAPPPPPAPPSGSGKAPSE